MRYKLVLLPCEATKERYHNAIVAEANKVCEVWDELHRIASNDQLYEVRDTKSGKVMGEDEFRALIYKLKGWN